MCLRRALATVLLASAHALAFPFTAQVVAVLDGDTVDVVHEQQPIRVRLASIDAPEKSQPYGQRSRQALAALVFRKQVVVIDQGRERHGRMLGVIMLGTTNVNAEQVRQGYAWVYRTYTKDPTLVEFESEARAARRGLWADISPLSPWLYRRPKQQR